MAKNNLISIENTFVDKVIIKILSLDDKVLKRFLEVLITKLVLACKIPRAVLNVKESDKVEKLPVGFDLEQVVSQALNKATGMVIINKIGTIPINLQLRLVRSATGTQKHTKIEIDKYMFERDDIKRDLRSIVKEVVNSFS